MRSVSNGKTGFLVGFSRMRASTPALSSDWLAGSVAAHADQLRRWVFRLPRLNAVQGNAQPGHHLLLKEVSTWMLTCQKMGKFAWGETGRIGGPGWP